MQTNQSKKIILKMPKQRRLLIIGMGAPVRSLVELASQYFVGGSVYILGKREHDPEEEGKLRALAGTLHFPVAFIDDINAKEAMTMLRRWRPNIGMNYGGLWIYKEAFIDLFEGRLLNCHAANLPDYRGPGDYGWEILNSERSISVTIHQLVRKVDAGAILIKKTTRFKKRDVVPMDFYHAIEELRIRAFTSFLRLAATSSTLTFTPQNDRRAAYWPRLKNTINGAINLDWSTKEVRVFIHAFREPFTGAFLYYRDQKIFVKSSELSPRKQSFHPFMNGLLINNTHEDVEVVVGGGSMLFREICDAKGRKMLLRKFRVGDRFYVPALVLEEAKRHESRSNR